MHQGWGPTINRVQVELIKVFDHKLTVLGVAKSLESLDSLRRNLNEIWLIKVKLIYQGGLSVLLDEKEAIATNNFEGDSPADFSKEVNNLDGIEIDGNDYEVSPCMENRGKSLEVVVSHAPLVSSNFTSVEPYRDGPEHHEVGGPDHDKFIREVGLSGDKANINGPLILIDCLVFRSPHKRDRSKNLFRGIILCIRAKTHRRRKKNKEQTFVVAAVILQLRQSKSRCLLDHRPIFRLDLPL
ncbi:hypothetical protein QVD17_39515 [Tagetes erecta]|uniref:Uncharacterized protein n=1 Tax=Tagetes erecta TaxID=13708 RepID=A0AAD8JQ79_TARER|nr:hypothetical protein QVD17_39515 [Tagetes erecta]